LIRFGADSWIGTGEDGINKTGKAEEVERISSEAIDEVVLTE
jgi:hypothetical protein